MIFLIRLDIMTEVKIDLSRGSGDFTVPRCSRGVADRIVGAHAPNSYIAVVIGGRSDREVAVFFDEVLKASDKVAGEHVGLPFLR